MTKCSLQVKKKTNPKPAGKEKEHAMHVPHNIPAIHCGAILWSGSLEHFGMNPQGQRREDFPHPL